MRVDFQRPLRHCTQFCRKYPPPLHIPLPLEKNEALSCSSLIEMTTGAIKT